jgi:peptide-methionine (S)-S-oxide reductase
MEDPAKSSTQGGAAPREIAVFGGGCFWCTEAIFKSLRGVTAVMPGYAGGTTPHPTYEAVCTGATGHAEVIRIEFDPGQVSFNDLLTVFFATHDPTTLNRQGADVGTQYRSIILYSTEKQKRDAEAFIKKLIASDPGGHPVVTELKPLEAFYAAEDYHRDYFAKNPGQPYCQVIIEPKVEKLQKEFAELLERKSG